MPISPPQKNIQKDSEGYELDDKGDRIYPLWAGFIPPGAKTNGSQRPPWVPQIANYWDETKPPRGWFKLADGSWGNALDDEHVAEHPELLAMLAGETAQRTASMNAPDEEAPEAPKEAEQPKADAAPSQVQCKVCERPFSSPHALRIHMNHHRKTDQQHAAEADKADKEA